MNNQKSKPKPKIIQKRKPKTSNSNNKLKMINYVLLFLVITLSVSVLSYYYFQEQTPAKEQKIIPTPPIEEKKIDIPHENKSEQILEQEIQKILEQERPLVVEPKPEEQAVLPEQTKKNYEEYNEELEKEYIHETVKKKEEVKVTQKKTIPKPAGRPKIAIIIDDVTMQSQVDNIKTVGYTVNMAFLPPTKTHPDSARIAQHLPFYMIHFPMEASSFKFEEEDTLHVGDSYEKIEATVKRFKMLYPNATYTNNHTGSTFTSNKESMDKLLRALKKYDFTFLDSRTTAKTVAKEYAAKYEVPFLGRNIFLDNTIAYGAILSQLKKAIDIANKTGYAIAIGHPHETTIKVLRESKELLKGLDVVYVNEMPTY